VLVRAEPREVVLFTEDGRLVIAPVSKSPTGEVALRAPPRVLAGWDAWPVHHAVRATPDKLTR
jgi:hypothetical protein